MTPQLQQAIRLLQLSTLELQTEIQDALDSNLMLEVEDENSEEQSESSDNYTTSDNPPGEEFADATGQQDESDQAAQASNSEIPDDLPVDSSWDDIYDNVASPHAGGMTSEGSQDYEISGSTAESRSSSCTASP